MKSLITITFFAVSFYSSAQSLERQVIGSTGGTSITSSLIVTSTVGEVAIATLASSSTILTQGYQQAVIGNSISVNEIENITKMTLFPNPTTNNSKLEITAGQSSQVTVAIYSAQGKLIENNTLALEAGVQSSVQLNVANQASGVYFVRITDENLTMKTLRLIKQ